MPSSGGVYLVRLREPDYPEGMGVGGAPVCIIVTLDVTAELFNREFQPTAEKLGPFHIPCDAHGWPTYPTLADGLRQALRGLAPEALEWSLLGSQTFLAIVAAASPHTCGKPSLMMLWPVAYDNGHGASQESQDQAQARAHVFQGPSLDGFYPVTYLAKHFDVSRDALRKVLERARQNQNLGDGDFLEAANVKQSSDRYFYRLAAVLPIILAWLARRRD